MTTTKPDRVAVLAIVTTLTLAALDIALLVVLLAVVR